MVRHPAASAAFQSAMTCLAALRLSVSRSASRLIRSRSNSARLRALGVILCMESENLMESPDGQDQALGMEPIGCFFVQIGKEQHMRNKIGIAATVASAF